jgi:hypothetical protein
MARSSGLECCAWADLRVPLRRGPPGHAGRFSNARFSCASCFGSLLHLERHNGDPQRFNFPEIPATDSLLLVERGKPIVCACPLSRKMSVVNAQILKHFDRFMLIHRCLWIVSAESSSVPFPTPPCFTRSCLCAAVPEVTDALRIFGHHVLGLGANPRGPPAL